MTLFERARSWVDGLRAGVSWTARRALRPSDARTRDEVRADSQSLGFAVDLCRVIQEELATEREIRLTLLDVGARTASGSNLIAQVFHPDAYTQIKLDVTALDLEATHAEEARVRYPAVRYRVGDVRSIRDRYDVVTCSHTLEHLADPGPVLEHLRTIARRLVIVAAPYDERLDGSRPNPSRHLFTFDEHFFARHPPARLEVFRSPHWSAGDCFLAVYEPAVNASPWTRRRRAEGDS